MYGGFIGFNVNSGIVYVMVSGKVWGIDVEVLGGLIGWNLNVVINNVSVYGDVSL